MPGCVFFVCLFVVVFFWWGSLSFLDLLFIVFVEFGHSSAIISLYHFYPLFPSQDSSNTYVSLLDIIPQVTETLLIFQPFFSLCFSVWIFSFYYWDIVDIYFLINYVLFYNNSFLLHGSNMQQTSHAPWHLIITSNKSLLEHSSTLY